MDTIAHLDTPACSPESPPPPPPPFNWAVSGVQVEPIWIPSGPDHCGCLWHSHTSHFQTISSWFLPSVTLTLRSLCHLNAPWQFVVKNTDVLAQLDGTINTVISSAESACSKIYDAHLCITLACPGVLCSSCFRVSLYSVHLAQRWIMILKCMRQWDQCYWHWNLLFSSFRCLTEIAVVLCVCVSFFLLPSQIWQGIKCLLDNYANVVRGIRNVGKSRPGKSKADRRRWADVVQVQKVRSEIAAVIRK